MILVAVLFSFAISSAMAATTITNSRVIFYELHTNKSILAQPVTNINQSSEFSSPFYQYLCECQDSKCGCCVGAQISAIGWNEKVCANASFNNAAQEWELGIYHNQDQLAVYKLNTAESLFCIPVVNPVNICVKVREINLTTGSLHLCFDLILKILSGEVYSLNFPCIDIPPKNKDVQLG